MRRTFDAARATVMLPNWRIDALVARPRAPRPGVFDDEGNGDQALWGVYAVGGDGWLPFGALDLYYLGFEDDVSVFAQGTARERRPRGNYFSQAAVLGPRNFFSIHPFVTVSPKEDWSLTADVNVFWRRDTNDGVYGPAGQLIRAPSGSDERFVGTAVSLTSQHSLADNLALIAIDAHSIPGDFMRTTGSSDDIDFVQLVLQFKF